MPSWREIEEQILYRDGSLRDIYVLEANPEGWRRFLEALPGLPWSCTYTWDGEPRPLPRTFCEARSKEAAALLTIDKSGLWLNCHFFSDTEIELDFRPDGITGPEVYECLLGFMSWLASVLDKPVVLTPENVPGDPLIEVTPAGRRIHNG